MKNQIYVVLLHNENYNQNLKRVYFRLIHLLFVENKILLK